MYDDFLPVHLPYGVMYDDILPVHLSLPFRSLSFLYLAWYERTFGQFGIAPTVDRWKTPEDTWLSVVVFGLVCLVVTRLLSLFDAGGVAPEPAGLILALIGSLALFNGLYVWSITKGPLALDEEE